MLSIVGETWESSASSYSFVRNIAFCSSFVWWGLIDSEERKGNVTREPLKWSWNSRKTETTKCQSITSYQIEHVFCVQCFASNKMSHKDFRFTLFSQLKLPITYHFVTQNFSDVSNFNRKKKTSIKPPFKAVPT